MAFQRPFLISLKRSDSSHKWGFGVSGGSDYGRPLVVQTVLEDSIAERSGLREGDEIIQVGRVNIQDFPLIKVQELLARCGNKIEMFVIREDLLSPRKGKEPTVVKAVVHNPYNSPLPLYSTENIADTLGKQAEALTEGHVSTDEEGAPENLSFKQKSAVFQLLEEQAKQESLQKSHASPVRKPNTAPPPPPKPKPPANDQINGYASPEVQHYISSNQYQDSRGKERVEYQSERSVHHYQSQREQPVQYQQTTVYQSSYQHTPGYTTHQSVQQPSPSIHQTTYQTNYQQQNQNLYHQLNQTPYQQQQWQQSPISPVDQTKHQTYQQSNQVTYQQRPKSPEQQQRYQSTAYQQLNQSQRQQQQQVYSQQKNLEQTVQKTTQSGLYQSQQKQDQRSAQQKVSSDSQSQVEQRFQSSQKVTAPSSPTAVSRAELKIGPPPPPRGSSSQKDSNMTAIYKQQYEQHLQQYYQQSPVENSYIPYEGYDQKPRAHIIKENIFENTSPSGTPITYKAPPAAPPKPHWPPPPQNDYYQRSPSPVSPSTMPVSEIWPPKKSTVTELPRTGFNPAAVREQGTGRRCVWPPPKPEDEMRSGRNTPQSPMLGRRIHWNPSPSPPTTRRVVFTSQSPSRRKDIVWPPPSPTNTTQNKENFHRASPRLSRRARFDEYVTQHASNNVPQTYRPPPGTQHVEFY